MKNYFRESKAKSEKINPSLGFWMHFQFCVCFFLLKVPVEFLDKMALDFCIAFAQLNMAC